MTLKILQIVLIGIEKQLRNLVITKSHFPPRAARTRELLVHPRTANSNMTSGHAITASKHMPAHKRTATTCESEHDDEPQSSLGLAEVAFAFDEEIEFSEPAFQRPGPTQQPNLEANVLATKSKSSGIRSASRSPSDVTLFPFLESRACWGKSLEHSSLVQHAAKTAGATPFNRGLNFR